VAIEATAQIGGNGSKQAANVEEEKALEDQAPLRVPFGRGPKDRVFERERQEKQKQHAPRHPRHKGRRR